MEAGDHVSSHGEASGGGPSSEERRPAGDSQPGEFTCHICLDTASNPVVSRCGHLFCWPCIHRWMATQRGNECPVCKAGISEANVTPIYLGGRTAERDDPRKRTPPRPSGERPAPDPNHQGNGGGGLWGGTNGFHFSLGVGAFPFFGLYATQNRGNPFAQPHPHQPAANREQDEREASAAKVFVFLGILAVLWLIL